MKIITVIPVKTLGEAKSRLSAALDAPGRSALMRMMFDRVMAAVRGADLPAIVVSRDGAIRDAAAANGFATLTEDGPGGLNDALAAGRDCDAARSAETLLVLPADLPRIEAADVRALLAAAPPAPCLVIAPDRAESGTNALLLAPRAIVPFGFGPDSFRTHCLAARAIGLEPLVVRRPGLSFDVDTVEDLARLRASPEG